MKMAPPSQALDLDITAVSGICGSISIACWVVVFSPQIIENFRRGSADGLSLQFIIIWLFGDIFNVLGGVMQGVLPTMIILALYYTLADIVLMGQCFYYRGFTFSDTPELPQKPPSGQSTIGDPHEATGLLSPPRLNEQDRRWSGEHLSPAVPLIIPPTSHPTQPAVSRRHTRLHAVFANTFAILMVCLAGVLGWYFSNGKQSTSSQIDPPTGGPSEREGSIDKSLEFDFWGQVFGYLCAALYLFSRVPQILLNYRRKSTEGVSMLFFLFACIGNLTYVLSILAYSPSCSENQDVAGATHLGTHSSHCGDGEARRIYARYIAVNASWIIGSAGTLLMDFAIFCQFFYYREQDMDNLDYEEDERPLLG